MHVFVKIFASDHSDNSFFSAFFLTKTFMSDRAPFLNTVNKICETLQVELMLSVIRLQKVIKIYEGNYFGQTFCEDGFFFGKIF